MTRVQLLRLRPGDIIRCRRTRALRTVVTSFAGKKLTPVGLVKVGHSWTDPRPTAWYDAHVILHGYVVTGRRTSAKKARAARDWTGPTRRRFTRTAPHGRAPI